MCCQPLKKTVTVENVLYTISLHTVEIVNNSNYLYTIVFTLVHLLLFLVNNVLPAGNTFSLNVK